MDFEEFVKNKSDCYFLDSGVALWTVNNNRLVRGMMLPKIHIQLFVLRGQITVVVDHTTITLSADSMVDILHGVMRIEYATDDVSAIFVLTTEAFITNFMKNKPPFSIDYIMTILEHPVLLLTHSQSATMQERLETVMSLLRDKGHYHQSDMVKCALWMVYLDMSNIFMNKNEEPGSLSETDRKRHLFMAFVKMLPLHVKEERHISYYASQLCVSCQYLERIVKAISGQTAYQWIQRTLIGDINRLLKDTDNSIQQIADSLGFPDQATFTKYYKRNVHITPSDFRSKNIV